MSTALTLHDGELSRYIAEVTKFPLLTREEELELGRRFRDQGDVTAAHSLVVSNLRFVVKIAYEYQGYGLKLLDLIQEGTIGLMQAVKKFDPEKGYRLISYAVWWIRANIHEYIMKTWSLVKLGTGRVRRKLFFKLRSERARLEQDEAGHDESSPQELAERLQVSEAELSEMEVRMAGRDFALDAPLSEDAGASHLDMLASAEENQEELLARQEEQQLLTGALADATEKLDEKERYVLEERLLNDEPRTLAEIGDSFGVSRERARQIESKVIAKLRQAVSRIDVLPSAAG